MIPLHIGCSQPLSCVDQLNQILHYLGTLSEETLCRVDCPRAQEYIRFLPIKPRVPFSTLIPHANPLVIDLSPRMLHFDHTKRITHEEVQNHPYLKTWHDPTEESACPTKFDFGFEDEDSIEGMKLIVKEIHSSRAEVRVYTRATGQVHCQER